VNLVVNGTLNTTSANLAPISPNDYFSGVTVGPGGRIIASGSRFATDEVRFDNDSVVNSGDLGNDTFATTLTVPYRMLPRLAANGGSFQDVRIRSASVTSGSTVTLGAMGSGSALRYIFPENFTISSGASLLVAPSVTAVIGRGVTLTVGGSMSLDTGSKLLFDEGYGGSVNLVVNGTLNTTSANLAPISPNDYFSGVTVKSNGRWDADRNTDVTIDRSTFEPNSGGTLAGIKIGSQLYLHSGTNAEIHGNDFSGIGNDGVVATGDSSATINLERNYWGVVLADIPKKILDRVDATTRPLVDYDPPLSNNQRAVVPDPKTGSFSAAAQTISLTATVSSGSTQVNEGNVTFTVWAGATQIGDSKTASVQTGRATASWTMPGGTASGVYTIQAWFDGGNSFLPGSDTGTLTIAQASTTTTVTKPAYLDYTSNTDQSLTLTANVSSTAGAVSGGAVSFQLYSGSSLFGSPVPGLLNGAGSTTVTYAIPRGTPAGTYTVRARYLGNDSFTASPEASQSFSINQRSTTTIVWASAPSVPYSPGAQTVIVNARVTSPAGDVGNGRVLFTLRNKNTGALIGETTPKDVAAGGNASTGYLIPAGTLPGAYTLDAVYEGTANLQGSDALPGASLSILTVTPQIVLAQPSSPTFDNDSSQTVELVAAVTTSDAPINGGTVTFTLWNNTAQIGSPSVGQVLNGSVRVGFEIPAGLAGGSYTVKADYGGIPGLGVASDTESLVVAPAATVADVRSFVAGYSATAQTIVVTGQVTSDRANPINTGRVSFRINGSAASATVVNNQATAELLLPADLTPGTYTILLEYDGTASLQSSSDTGTLTIEAGNPRITWPTPAPIIFGTPLTAAQLNATASVPGTFQYTPYAGQVPDAGTQILTAQFTPAEQVRYKRTTAGVAMEVQKATPYFTALAVPSPIGYGRPEMLRIGGKLLSNTIIPANTGVKAQIGNASGSGLVQSDGSFTIEVNVSGLDVSTYTILYTFAGTDNFVGAEDRSTTLTIQRGTQVLSLGSLPTEPVRYGESFIVQPTSSVPGLPVLLSATNATVTARGDGSFNVTPTSSTAPIELAASQVGNGNVAEAAVTARVNTRKGLASVTMASVDVMQDGLQHPVSASTTPAGLPLSINYTKDGIPTGLPTEPGLYVATATVSDPNYEGSNAVTVTIQPKALARVDRVTMLTNRQKQATAFEIVFTDAVQAGPASSIAAYAVQVVNGKKLQPALKLKTATYNASTRTVTITLAKPQATTRPIQLTVNGNSLLDTLGRLLDGNNDNQPGGNAVALFKPGTRQVTPSAVRLASAPAVDALAISGSLPLVKSSSLLRRRRA
jgi:hypothetical protein